MGRALICGTPSPVSRVTLSSGLPHFGGVPHSEPINDCLSSQAGLTPPGFFFFRRPVMRDPIQVMHCSLSNHPLRRATRPLFAALAFWLGKPRLGPLCRLITPPERAGKHWTFQPKEPPQ